MTRAQSPEADASQKPRDWEAAFDWWRALQDKRENDERNPLRDRAARARLRRLEPALAAADPAVIALYRAMGGAGWDAAMMARAARLALVLAHVRSHDANVRFPKALGPSKFSEDDGLLKQLRLRALMKADCEEDVVRHFRRALDLLKGCVNVRDLARVLARWDAPGTRTRFAFDYYGAGPAAPDADVTAE